jgi:dolichyl-phosphate-mannose-protein mannosyltransferase
MSHARPEGYQSRPWGDDGRRAPAGSWRAALARSRWPLLVVLGVQALLSLRLVGRPVVQDEATYVDAGNGEIAHWLHGAGTLPYPTFFSGAPVAYPPLSAAVHGIGGLLATRLMSLCFMLVATALLWAVARRLAGGLAALCAAGLFAATAAVQYMGALATFDALALMLLAGACWCAVRAVDHAGGRRGMLLAAVCVLLVAANVTKYASALWDPIVVAVAGVWEARREGPRSGLIASAITGVGTLAGLGILLLAGGGAYWQGVLFSTLHRTADSGTPPLVILGWSAAWVGVVAALAVTGAALLGRWSPDRALVAWVLVAAVFLAPLNQARIGVIVSLFKHVGFGAWFAAIPAGYAVAVLVNAGAARRWRVPAALGAALAGAAAVVVVAAAVIGVAGSQAQTEPALYSPGAVAQLRPLLARNTGPWLADSPTVIIYYTGTPSVQWRNTYGFTYIEPHTGRVLKGTQAYLSALQHNYFGLVVLRSGRMSIPVNKAIYRECQKSPRYDLTVIREDRGGQAPAKLLVWRRSLSN